MSHGGLHLARIIHPGHALAAGRIRGFHNHGIIPFCDIGDSRFDGRVSFCPRNVESVFRQKSPEFILVLQYLHRLERSESGKAHLLLDISRRNHTRIHPEGHNPVNLLFLGDLQDCLLVDNADIDIFITELMGNIVRQIIGGYHVIALFVRRLDNRQKIPDAA